MKQIPETEEALVIRTDFADEAAWEAIKRAIVRPVGGFRAYVNFLDEPEYEGIGVEQLMELVPEGSDHTYLFVVDGTALSHPEQPILCLDLTDEPGRTFRVIPSEMWGVENNLSLANMDFDEFATLVDADGIFRGLGMDDGGWMGVAEG